MEERRLEEEEEDEISFTRDGVSFVERAGPRLASVVVSALSSYPWALSDRAWPGPATQSPPFPTLLFVGLRWTKKGF